LFDPQNGALSGNKLEWPFLRLRIIPYQIQTGAMNMALDYYLARGMTNSDFPVLRFYGWKPSCLSFGYHQSSNELNRQKLDERGYDLVRRPTGGSAIFHSAELTYSIVIPRTHWNQHELYGFIHQVFYLALHEMGYPVEIYDGNTDLKYLNRGAETFACFNRSARSELRFRGRKILGSAQKVYRNSVLQHGSLLITRKQDEIIDFLDIPGIEQEEHRRILLESSVTLTEINPKPIDPETITNQISHVLERKFSVVPDFKKLTEEELSEASVLKPAFMVK